ncbi:hypothetical protein AVEN_187781-1 [Araneus ventricosus]|uniref:Uncharacterized protein n=1 Tax=Araneus ventricosus TaxID=182803 RepID=A0A4Y2UII3_ARAVE|nr:hypothetical protein AVEN_187781-1 [Araneus ventricosus]
MCARAFVFSLTSCFRCHRDSDTGLFCASCARNPSDEQELFKAALFSFINSRRSGVLKREIIAEFDGVPSPDIDEVMDALISDRLVLKSRHRFFTSINEARKAVGLSNQIRYALVKAIDMFPKKTGASIEDIQIELEEDDEEAPQMVNLAYTLRKLSEQGYIHEKANGNYIATPRAYIF